MRILLAALLLAGTASPGRADPAVPTDPAGTGETLTSGYVPGDSSARRTLTVYFPGERAGAPVLVFFHGGGWRSGDKSTLEGFARRLASEGVVVALPNYRLAPDHKHPRQIEDAAAAARWVAARLPSWRADAGCLIIGGHSAGGHLAALLATAGFPDAEGAPAPPALAGVVAVSGVFHIRPREGGATHAFISSVFGEDEAVWVEASPASRLASREEGAPLPPFALIWSAGEHPLAVEESVRFERLLRRAGHEVMPLEVPGAGHDAGLGRVTAGLLARLSRGRCGAGAAQ